MALLYRKNRTGYYIAADPIGSAVIDHNALRRPFHLPLLHALTPPVLRIQRNLFYSGYHYYSPLL